MQRCYYNLEILTQLGLIQKKELAPRCESEYEYNVSKY